MGSILVCYTLSEAKEHAATADGQRGEGQSWHQCHVTYALGAPRDGRRYARVPLPGPRGTGESISKRGLAWVPPG